MFFSRKMTLNFSLFKGFPCSILTLDQWIPQFLIDYKHFSTDKNMESMQGGRPMESTMDKEILLPRDSFVPREIFQMARPQKIINELNKVLNQFQNIPKILQTPKTKGIMPIKKKDIRSNAWIKLEKNSKQPLNFSVISKRQKH